MTMRRVIELGILLALGLACTSTLPAQAPSQDTTTTTRASVHLTLSPEGDGSAFTAQLEDRSFTLPGGYTMDLTTGSHTISGSFHGRGLTIGFANIDKAGAVRSGSLRSQTGPSPQMQACGVTYLNGNTPQTERTFQLQFEVISGSANTCGGPAP